MNVLSGIVNRVDGGFWGLDEEVLIILDNLLNGVHDY
jgi:hypothetical protein